MNIAIPAQSNSPDAKADSRFGRAAFFAVYDTDAKQWNFHDNAQNLQAAQGAGVQAAQNVAQTGAEVLLAGNVGPKAMAALRAGGIRVFQLSENVTLTEAVKQYIDGKLQPLDQANVPGHWM
ncbi:MAG: dinitrogenase iron-molybdenum cofactor biosynthesis protein [Phycisphaerae bacterium]|nr:dinitrogenase iron-molybdenum cofactor biosynthesis protein [Phycisphaerae bacterium]